MRKLVMLSLISSLLFGCITEKKCNERYPNQIKDSTYSMVTYVHDTVPAFSPYFAFGIDTSSEELPKDMYFHAITEHKGNKATIDIHNKKITVKCEVDAKNDTIFQLRKQIENFNTKVETKYLVCDKQHVTRWLNFCFWHTIISWIVFVIAIIILVLKRG